MRYYLRSTRRAAIMLFRRGSDADFAHVDDIDAHNGAIMDRIYSDLMAGRISAARITSGKTMDVYTRSLRGAFVQVSHFSLLNGDWIACSHGDAHSGAELASDCKTGNYISIYH